MKLKLSALAFTAALFVTAFAYWNMETPTDAYWMMPLMGAAQRGPFAGDDELLR